MKPIESVKEGMALVDGFIGSPREFQLAVPNSLIDPGGINMAIITDRVLARCWEPDGFTQGKGFRVYRYKELQ